MSHHPHQFQFPNFFDLNNSHQQHALKLEETVEHTFDERERQFSNVEGVRHDDHRTEDQVRNDLNFSIEDLLSKISKATADFQQQPKHHSQTHKQQPLNSSFKISNLSTSTETNSNQQHSDRIIEKHQPFIQINQKRQSQPQKDAFSNNDRFRQTNAQKHNSVNHGFGETRQEPRHESHYHQGNSWNSIMKSDAHIQFSKPEVKTEPITQWGRNSSRNQPSFNQTNTNLQSVNEWGRSSSRNQPIYTHKEPEKVNEWGRNSSRNQFKTESINQPNHNQTPLQWGRNSSRNQPKIQPIKQWTSKTPKNYSANQYLNEWKPSGSITQFGENSAKKRMKTDVNEEFKTQQHTNQYSKITSKNHIKYEPLNQYKSSQTITQWGRNSSRNHLNEVSSFKNVMEGNRLPEQKLQPVKTTSKQQLCNPFEMQVKIQPTKKESTKTQPVQKSFPQQVQINSPKREIQALLNPFHNSGFGKNLNNIHKKPQKTQQIAASIIIEDDPPAQQCQQILIQHEKKVNSLFDTRKIRQVAASRIMDSPDKMKKNKTTKSPFIEITQAKTVDTIKYESSNSHHEIPLIKIHNVQRSEIIPQNSGPKLTIQDFHLGKQLGSGKFGDVYQAVHKASGMLCAIKKIFKSTIMEYNMIQQFTRELKIHYSLNYPNIIKLYTHFDDEYHIFLVMEYGEGGMLMEKIKNGQKFASVIVEQMLRAVEFLQNKKIAHRDIKPENIVLMFGDTAKLCDFGWSRVFDSDMKKTFCGTLDYVSPQMKDKGEYSLKIDIWSLGVLTFELLCGYAPFKDEITNWKRKGGNMNKAWNWNILYPLEVSSVAESFMRNLLKQNPNERANIRFCLNHLFIRKYNQMSFDEEQDTRFKQIAYTLKEEN